MSIPREADVLRMGLVGGSGAAFIGRVHVWAATLDGQARLTAGALSSRPQIAREAGETFGLDPDRTYESSDELFDRERSRPEEERIHFVTVATPNHTHFPIASAALKAGFHVVCDKPLTVNLEQARELVDLVRQSGRVLVLTHNYSGYPMVRQARDMIANGEIGQIQAVRVNYIQGWLKSLKPGLVPPRGAWKSDPEKNGPGGTLSDIGTHAYHLARYVTRLRAASVNCHLATFTPDRELDDYCQAIIRFEQGVIGTLTASQVTHGRLNDLTLEIDGTSGSLVWRQESPNELCLRRFDSPMQIYERHPGASYTTESARAACRIPGGHPEAFLEAFANVYRDGFREMLRVNDGAMRSSETDFPNVHDGAEGVLFVEQCLASHRERGSSVSLASSF